MKRDFTPENFEDFLKRSADGLRMKAPDKVWQNLSKDLNKRRRRTMFGLSAFLLISAAVGYSVLSNVSEQPTAETNQTTNETSPFRRNAPASSPKNTTDRLTSTPPESSATAFSTENNSLENATTNNTLAPVIDIASGQHVPEASTTTEAADASIATTNDGAELIKESFTPTIVDSYTEFDEQTPSAPAAANKKLEPAALPYTIESVVNSYKAKSSKRKFETQLYFTPTISYRKLSENKSYLRNLDPNAIPASYPALHSSVNNNVTHKPDLGFELGFATKYALSNKLKIRAGLQFNVNRYEIKAFSSNYVNATIALNNGGRIDSFTTRTGLSAVKENGYRTNWLKNLSFQASLPVGAEFIVSDNGNVQFGFGATVQPTYILNDRAYLITTDYKNYTQADWLVRRWNVNTAFETFVNINSGKTRWQIGPQVRYQLLSSFISKYPVKENLFDFGLKVGVSLGK
ncbi:MAG TPA: hypothetical protein VMR70_15435 [Flavisolibacter sp.]|nr:hypothetical protein [Flavisolibacter sp.]